MGLLKRGVIRSPPYQCMEGEGLEGSSRRDANPWKGADSSVSGGWQQQYVGLLLVLVRSRREALLLPQSSAMSLSSPCRPCCRCRHPICRRCGDPPLPVAAALPSFSSSSVVQPQQRRHAAPPHQRWRVFGRSAEADGGWNSWARVLDNRRSTS